MGALPLLVWWGIQVDLCVGVISLTFGRVPLSVGIWTERYLHKNFLFLRVTRPEPSTLTIY